MSVAKQDFKYLVAVLGPGAARHGPNLKRRLRMRLNELGVEVANAVGFADAKKMPRRIPKPPIVGVYFGGAAPSAADHAVVCDLKAAAAPILPVVADIAQYNSLVPQELHEINGLQLVPGAAGFDPVVNLVMENLGLLRRSRRLFISYRRTDASTEALQLRHELDARAFDAFLDTHSVPKGDKFQEVLWHRLADSDVALVLDTKGFLESRWTREELARAEAMTIGIIQVIWPDVVPAPFSELCERVYLEESNFEPGGGLGFTAATTKSLADVTERLRARSLAARHENLVREFCEAASWAGTTATVQPDRFIKSRTRSGRAVTAIPAVGVPDAPGYHETHLRFPRGAAGTEVWLVYDQRGLRPEWMKYLAFLDAHLPVKTMRITDVAKNLA
jgi:TIR domain